MQSKNSELISCSQFEFHITFNTSDHGSGESTQFCLFLTRAAHSNIHWLSHMSFIVTLNKVPGTKLLSWVLISD
jgi:hypothetical protein